MPYEDSVFPQGIDTFKEMADLDRPEYVVQASLINKLQNALRAVQGHVLYTAAGPNADGPVFYTISRTVSLTADTSRTGYTVRMDPEPAVVASLFGGAPFSEPYGALVSVAAYRVSGGQRSYFRVRSGMMLLAATDQYCQVGVNKGTDNWRAGDNIDVTLTLIRY